MYKTDRRVDAYINTLPQWQQDVCQKVRDIVHSADPEVEETIKRTNRPYFVLDGNICALLGTKDHVNIFLYDRGIVPDPHNIITAGHDNKTARQISVYEGDKIPVRHLKAMFKEIIKNNRAGDRRAVRSNNSPKNITEKANLALKR